MPSGLGDLLRKPFREQLRDQGFNKWRNSVVRRGEASNAEADQQMLPENRPSSPRSPSPPPSPHASAPPPPPSRAASPPPVTFPETVPLRTPDFAAFTEKRRAELQLADALQSPLTTGPGEPTEQQLEEMMRFTRRTLSLLDELNSSLNAVNNFKIRFKEFRDANNRMNFNSEAAKKKKKGYDLAHRASFDVLQKLIALRQLRPPGLVQQFDRHLQNLCHAMGVSQSITSDFFSKVDASRQEVRSFISAMNSALKNLSPGHSGINRATGARFDPAFKRRGETWTAQNENAMRGRTYTPNQRDRGVSVEFTPNSREIAKNLMALGALPPPRYSNSPGGSRYVESSHLHTKVVPTEKQYRRLLWELSL